MVADGRQLCICGIENRLTVPNEHPEQTAAIEA